MTTITIVNGNEDSTMIFNDLLSESPYTIIYFYPRDNTPGCTVEANNFTELYDKFLQYGIQIVGVSKDSVSSHCNFIKKYGLRPRYISDPELILHKQYDARGEKKNYGKIVQGVIRGTVLLDRSGTIIHHRKNIRAKGHAQRVLDYVQEHIQKEKSK